MPILFKLYQILFIFLIAIQCSDELQMKAFFSFKFDDSFMAVIEINSSLYNLRASCITNLITLKHLDRIETTQANIVTFLF